MCTLSKFKRKKTLMWVLSMVFSFTGYAVVSIFIKKKKFYHYADWMYDGNFKDKSFVIEVYNHYFTTEISSLYWWLPVCIVLDITLRKFIFPSVQKPQHTV